MEAEACFIEANSPSLLFTTWMWFPVVV